MSDIYYHMVSADTPKNALLKITEKEREFQEKYSLRTDHLMKVESIDCCGETDNGIYNWRIRYSFRRASL